MKAERKRCSLNPSFPSFQLHISPFSSPVSSSSLLLSVTVLRHAWRDNISSCARHLVNYMLPAVDFVIKYNQYKHYKYCQYWWKVESVIIDVLCDHYWFVICWTKQPQTSAGIVSCKLHLNVRGAGSMWVNLAFMLLFYVSFDSFISPFLLFILYLLSY